MRVSDAVYSAAYAILFVKSIHAQGGLTGPTVTPTASIVPGSTSLISISKAASVDLTSNFISGLPTSITATTTSTPTPQIIFVTGCNTCSSSSSGAATTASIVNTTNEDQSKLSSSDLGAIIGGCAGGLIVIIVATVFLCIRRKKKRDFYAGRDFPTTAVIPPPIEHDVKHSTYPASAVNKESNHAISNNSFYIDNNDSTIKRYNLSTAAEDAAHDTIATPPVILYSDALNSNPQQNIVMSNSGTVSSPSPTPRPSRPLERKVSQGARLSKYNFLSQAFSQMRTSYAEDHPNNAISMNTTTTTTAPKSLNTDPTHYNHDSMVLPHDKPKNHPMYQQQGTSFNSMSPPPIPAMASTSSFFEPNTTRESTMTVATLHAPLFRQHQQQQQQQQQQHQQQQQQRATPSPSSLSVATARQKQPYYTSHLAVSPTSPIRTAGIDADSVVSDVSQYSSKRSFSTTTSAALNQDNKPYPYF